MKCKVCKKSFEPWDADFECDCEDGMVERYYDWSFGEPQYVKCDKCNGGGCGIYKEQSFCSEDCREDYFNNSDYEL